MRIDIMLIDFEFERIVELRECFIEFNERFLRVKMNYRSSRPKDKDDRLLPWEEEEENFEYIFDKSSLSGFSKIWYDRNKHWQINMFGTEIPTVRFPFKRNSEATNLFDKLLKWRYGNEILNQ